MGPGLPRTWAELHPLLLCLALMAFQQLSGINAVMFYSVTIFAGTKVLGYKTISIAKQCVIKKSKCLKCKPNTQTRGAARPTYRAWCWGWSTPPPPSCPACWWTGSAGECCCSSPARGWRPVWLYWGLTTTPRLPTLRSPCWRSSPTSPPSRLASARSVTYNSFGQGRQSCRPDRNILSDELQPDIPVCGRYRG